MKSTQSFTLFIALIAIATFLLINFYTPKPSKPTIIDTQHQPTIGNPEAKLHFVLFEDLKCYNCMRYHVEVYPSINKLYIQNQKAKYTIINLAFIPGSIPAANAARCVYAQNKKAFFRYVNNIYQSQPLENQNWATIPRLMKFAQNLENINKKQLSQCIYNNTYKNLIQHNTEIAMKVMKGDIATPSLYINGHIVQPLTIKRIQKIVKTIQ